MNPTRNPEERIIKRMMLAAAAATTMLMLSACRANMGNLFDIW